MTDDNTHPLQGGIVLYVRTPYVWYVTLIVCSCEVELLCHQGDLNVAMACMYALSIKPATAFVIWFPSVTNIITTTNLSKPNDSSQPANRTDLTKASSPLLRILATILEQMWSKRNGTTRIRQA